MNENFKLQYQGFLNTPNLWNNSEVHHLNQFELSTHIFQNFDAEEFNEVRLGKRVEQFFNFQIENASEYKMLTNNFQIKDKKITIGELDAIVKSETETLHIEIVYKFYLYDPKIKTENELDKWIGPNRKDTLIYKLNKLKEKQLPLLYSQQTKNVLEQFTLKIENILQKVCYKAQLFLPFEFNDISIFPLNKVCVYGFYLSYNEIEKLSEYKIYIPKKLDWLVTPFLTVDWLNFEVGKEKISAFINQERSPMLWLKSKNDELYKCFITFW